MTFQIPTNLDRYLAALSKIYGKDGKRMKQEILVNARIEVDEAWTYDNWNDGIHGHALHLLLPENLFLAVNRQKDEIEKQIQTDLNKIHHVQDEHIAAVFLEISRTT